MDNPAILIKDLSVSYERKRVLSNIFLQIDPGNIYGVIGPNGAGKSTLFKAILGLIESNTGSISIFGKPVEDFRKNLVYIPQKDEVDWHFPATALDIVIMGRYPHKKFYQRIDQYDRQEARKAMAALGIENLQNRQIGSLSGGQQQRIFLARALCQQADIFLLDEPFVGVDMTTEERIIGMLKELADRGKTLMVIHHDLSTVEAYFNKVVLLNQRLIDFGDTSSVFTSENISKTYSAQLTILHKTGLID